MKNSMRGTAAGAGVRRMIRVGILVAVGGTVPGLSSTASAQTCADHGIPVNGYPKWQERAMMVYTNACRIAPVAYRNTFFSYATNILQPSVYPAVPPLQWQLGLNQSARAHSTDLATTTGCSFGHTSCNGTSSSTRIGSYYPGYAAIGENIAAGYFDPQSAINALILDNVNNFPAADNSQNDGHRRNIMSATFTQFGNGYATGTNTYTRYWTQDFGKPSGTTTVCSPIPSGSHHAIGGEVVFLVNFYDPANATPRSANIVINGASTPLNLYIGTAARGTYRYALPTWVGIGCRSYHYEITDAAGTLHRYPTRGELKTFGENGCSEEYTPNSINPPPPPPPCPADFNGSGGSTVDDLFAYFNAWFVGDVRADFNGAGGVTVDDLFGYINAWFTGCP